MWVLDATAHRAATERAIDALYRAHGYLDPSAERIEAPLDGAPLAGEPAPALRDPTGRPLVILIPGLDSTKEEFFHHENAFLARGMATLSMDGPGQGESGFALPIRPDYEVAVAAMLDALAGRDDLDLGRVGAVGVSLGGYYAPRAAAFEPRIRAVAAISGPYDFGERWDELPPLTRETFIVKSGARDERDGRERAGRLDAARRRRADQPAGAVRHRRPGPDRPLAADRAGGAGGAERDVRAVRARLPRVQQHPVPVPAARGGLDGRAARAALDDRAAAAPARGSPAPARPRRATWTISTSPGWRTSRSCAATTPGRGSRTSGSRPARRGCCAC